MDDKSTVRQVANGSGLPVLSPGGYGALKTLHPQGQPPTIRYIAMGSDVKKLYENETFPQRHPDLETAGYPDSKAGAFYITYPWWWSQDDVDNWKKTGFIPPKP